MNSALKKLWPAAVAERDIEFEWFEPETDTENRPRTRPRGLCPMGLEVDEDDVSELVDEDEKLSAEEMKELQVMQHTEFLQEISIKED